jgi:hypothetical protein
MQRAGLVKPNAMGPRRPSRSLEQEECSAAELHTAMTILMLLSGRINHLLTLIAPLPNAASIRFRFYYGKGTLLLLFVLFY